MSIERVSDHFGACWLLLVGSDLVWSHLRNYGCRCGVCRCGQEAQKRAGCCTSAMCFPRLRLRKREVGSAGAGGRAESGTRRCDTANAAVLSADAEMLGRSHIFEG